MECSVWMAISLPSGPASLCPVPYNHNMYSVSRSGMADCARWSCVMWRKHWNSIIWLIQLAIKLTKPTPANFIFTWNSTVFCFCSYSSTAATCRVPLEPCLDLKLWSVVCREWLGIASFPHFWLLAHSPLTLSVPDIFQKPTVPMRPAHTLHVMLDQSSRFDCPFIELQFTISLLSYLDCSNREVCLLAEKYNALVFLDECHATGFLGDTGRYINHSS